MQARRKPVEVFAFQYRNDTDVTELLRLISLNLHEPVRFDPIQKTIHIQKIEERLPYAKGIGLYTNKTLISVSGLLITVYF